MTRKKKKKSPSEKHSGYNTVKKYIINNKKLKHIYCKYRSAYYFEHKEKYSDAARKYYQEHIEQIREKRLKYYLAHKEELREYRRIYMAGYRKGLRRNKDGRHGNTRYGPGDFKFRLGDYKHKKEK
jgi:hypothetical protein